ncbi:DUF2922 domain-containing protein [Lactobacillus sp. YT155]|uniref:DUF2922 domain-containing protein n=1 Tax=Lactobacillus sp. YT155 TaxID=3060955 RepID=UPI00265FD7F7|nr:DUF2922 domain-containing protein [Lactobacillus sp. YT155]MDO1604755.1 DUF2922 domain-containing protein [Lactobacillus sp. YT155]
MKKLQLGFKTEDGKTKILTLNYFKADLTSDEVKKAMQSIADAKLFVKEGQEMYHQAVSAKYVTRTEEDIFVESPVA